MANNTVKQPTPAERLRVGRMERECCVDELQEHYAHGRLGDQELTERVGAALSATTRADLRNLLADLPGAPVSAVEGRSRRFSVAVATAAAVVLLGIGAVAAVSGQPVSEAAPVEEQICLATGESEGSAVSCPEATATQQQIFADADAADRAAQQLLEAAERHPDAALEGLLERASVSSGRAQDAVANSRQIVLAAQGEPTEKLLAGPAAAAQRAARDTQTTLDLALDRLDG